MIEKWVFIIAGSFLAISVILCLVRFKIGPSTLDRILALDLLGILAISVLALMSLYFKNYLILDITIAFALISFVTALAFGAYFFERQGEKK